VTLYLTPTQKCTVSHCDLAEFKVFLAGVVPTPGAQVRALCFSV